MDLDEALLKKTIQRGHPPTFAVAHDLNSSPGNRKTWRQKYASRNLGSENIGAPIEFEGKVEVHQFSQNKLEEYGLVKEQSRDEIFGVVGTPPAIVAVIESGNIGGGTGTSQFKNFKVNTCGPYQELVLEAFTFAILEQGFGVPDKRCSFEELDWRDDEVVEKIRNTRVDRGIWSIDRARDDVGEPPTTGGEDPIIVLSRDVVRVKDIAAKAEQASLGPGAGPGTGLQGVPPGKPKPDDDDEGDGTPAGAGKTPKGPKGPRQPSESAIDDLLETWSSDFQVRHRRAMAELSEVGRDG